jgi:hypothetical protein
LIVSWCLSMLHVIPTTNGRRNHRYDERKCTRWRCLVSIDTTPCAKTPGRWFQFLRLMQFLRPLSGG